MKAPLEGIRVVELATFVAAPSAGALLADLGAEVTKVEVPDGEIYRHSKPKLLGIKDSESFRDIVLNTRDMAAEATGTIAAGVAAKVEGETDVLGEIRDSLLRIEERLNQGN